MENKNNLMKYKLSMSRKLHLHLLKITNKKSKVNKVMKDWSTKLRKRLNLYDLMRVQISSINFIFVTFININNGYKPNCLSQ